ncbi:hypothetical protein SAMN05421805_101131 [Saccharopolyspora antimicrobica]|uniref:Uncharacterized protein n=1 Tax=Saccharopolyspora antimicrobica TaxID=455193 RepID=A0A1I4QIL4_9PSEU|nr:hypothetical protein [Saccharopolyspora antimicrobica]RKT84939.1 hypothetical protein ATL45_3270 [Saccharopolyspora antimicrobica]SFM39606.1 hypothetical protein SAMN05421805_101131 [Saccharopolyspora antimicrobica]
MTSQEQDSAAPRPGTVDGAFWAGIAAVVVGFAILVTSFLMVSDAELQVVIEESAAQGQLLSPEQARAVYTGVLVLVTAIVAVIAALWIMFLFFLRKGRNWARIVVTAVGAVWILLTLPSVTGGSVGGAAAALLAVLQVLTVAATIVLAYLTPSNEYFRR